jgi:hypothetical protein
MTEEKTDPQNAPIANASDIDNFTRLIGMSWKGFEQLDAISKTIMQNVQEERQADVELAVALLQCPTPAVALNVYTTWLSQRTTALMKDGTTFAQLWTQLWALPRAEVKQVAAAN